MKRMILVTMVSLVVPFLSQAETGLETMPIVELARMADNCNIVRMKMVAAGLRASKETLENTSFAAAFSRDSAARSLEGQARGQDKMTEAMAGQSLAICAFVDKEMVARLSR